jgi:Na+/proline symporter
MESYFNADHDLSPLAVALSACGMAISGVTFLGTPGVVYNGGWGVVIGVTIFGSLPGILMANLWIGRPIRQVSQKLGSYSITDLINKMFNSPSLNYVGVPAIVLFSIFFLIVQWVAIGNLFVVMMGLSYLPCMVVGVIIVTIYCLVGGNNSNAQVSIFQLLIALFAALYLGFTAVHLSGGLSKMNATLANIDPNLVKVGGSTFPWATIWSMTLLYDLGYMGQPGIVTKYYGIRDKKLFPKCFMAHTCVMVGIVFVVVVGVGYRAMVAQGIAEAVTVSDQVTPLFILNFTNPWIAGLLVAATLAAIMTTAASLMLTTASSVVQDILGNMFT